MKRTVLLLGCLLSMGLYAQTSPNGVYSTTEPRPTVLEKPASREIMGGTVICVNFDETNAISATQKGAFEYACRIWEENIPTTFPINITVKFGTLQNPQCLAYVEPTVGLLESDAYSSQCFSNVYFKRKSQIDDQMLDYATCTVEQFRDAPDATITFSTRQPFDYTINSTAVPVNKYDFVTVALQAIGKALGFLTNTAIVGNNQLIRLEPRNEFTSVILGNDGVQNYKKAVSGTASFSGKGKNWALYCPATFDYKFALNYFASDPNNNETLLMQPGIPKGVAIRYIGTAMQSFFDFCGWNKRNIAVGGSASFDFASTANVIAYQKPVTTVNAPQIKQVSETDETLEFYRRDCEERGGDGHQVLLKNGRWRMYDGNLRSIVEENNDDYARTSDGYLRIKHIYHTSVGEFLVMHVEYGLYDYIPQNPKSSFNSYTIGTYNIQRASRRPYNTFSAEDEYIDTEIGFQQIEGCKKILVEQTDADYPVPYTYFVEPEQGYFIAYMNKRYASTFKLTYINDNGQTIGQPLTIDLSGTQKSAVAESKLSVSQNGVALHYKLSPQIENLNGQYTICNVNNTMHRKQGEVQSSNGVISIIDLPKGIYTFSITCNGKTYSTKWMK